MKIIYSPLYTIKVPHKFKTEKFEKTCKLLIENKIINPENVIEPQIPKEDDLLLAHSSSWIKKLLDIKIKPEDELTAEMPINKDVIFAHLLHCGGTCMAAEIAYKEGLGLHCGGGAHHAHKSYGAGFCLINDIAVAARKTLKRNANTKILVIDLDVHQGDGTAEILKDEKNIFTFSAHSKNIYPTKKVESSFDLEFESGVGALEYNRLVMENLKRVFHSFKPNFVFYNAGADVYVKDTLGDLSLSIADIEKRDELVFKLIKKNSCKTVVTLSGGYAQDIDDTVRIHFNTIRKAVEIFVKN